MASGAATWTTAATLAQLPIVPQVSPHRLVPRAATVPIVSIQGARGSSHTLRLRRGAA